MKVKTKLKKLRDEEFKEDNKALNDQGEGKVTNSFCRGFLLVDWSIVDFRSMRHSTNKQRVSDISTVFISRVF